MSVFNDTLFLSNLEVVDYSIIVGLELKTQKLVVGIIGQEDTQRTHETQRESEKKNTAGERRRKTLHRVLSTDAVCFVCVVVVACCVCL